MFLFGSSSPIPITEEISILVKDLEIIVELNHPILGH